VTPWQSSSPRPNPQSPDIRVKRFETRNPDYRVVATATFEAQPAMTTLGISLAKLEPGEVDLAMAIEARAVTDGVDNLVATITGALMASPRRPN
jgi:adenosylcobinamide amidohydrolase